MKRTTLIAAGLVLLAATMLGCASGTSNEEPAIANPASTYCLEQGGMLDIREDEEGNQYGVCVFDDGSECDEWAFYRGECEPGSG